MKKILSVVNAVALLLTIVINYLGSSGMLTGNTMKTMADRYHTLITPSGFTFSIWGLIYLSLGGFVIYSGSDSRKGTKIQGEAGWWFVCSCLCNSAWVWSWLSDYTGISVMLMIGLLFSLSRIMINTRMELDAHPLKDYLLVYWPFAIYAGWVSVAMMVNISAFLVKIGWNGWGIGHGGWAVIVLSMAGLLNIIMIIKRNLREFASAGVWALLGISVANMHPGGSPLVRITCYIIMIFISVFIIRSGMKSQGRSAARM